jgi:hypothetical protein
MDDKKTFTLSAIIIVCAILFLFLFLFILTAKFFGITISLAEIVSLSLSGIAIIFSVSTFFRKQKTDTMPVLVFVRQSEMVWLLQNVGKGPAITVKVSDKNSQGKWDDGTLFSPIAAGASLKLDTLEKDTDYRAVYTDIKGSIYSSLCIKNINEFFEKDKFPDWKPYATEWQRRKSREDIRKMF